MGNRDWNKQTVRVVDGDRYVESIRRIVFGDLGGFGIEPRPDATGLVNFRGAIATVHRDSEGALFIDLAEPVLHGRPPLTANWN